MTRSSFRASLLTFFILSVIAIPGRAQLGWEAYFARYEEGPGSVLVDMGAIESAPRSDLPFLIVTGVDCHSCTQDGFPVKPELKKLYRLSDDINRQLVNIFLTSKKWLASDSITSDSIAASPRAGKNTYYHRAPMLVGTFTHRCQRLDYIYVADTLGIRETLERFYKKHYERYTFYIELFEDPEWDGYRKFLYPNQAVRTFMSNYRAITHMTDMGDALSRPRFVEHLIYFDTINDRELFIRYIGGMKYDIQDAREIRRDGLRYLVRLAKFGTVSLEEMNNQTTYLSTKARDFNGVYEGWETKLIGTKQRVRLLCNAIAEPTNTAK